MFAMQIHTHGAPELLAPVQLPLPQLESGQALLRVRACGLNRLDLLLRAGGVFQPALPRTPGTDIAGEVVALAEDVTTLAVGTRVLVAPILSCGSCAHCLGGEDNLCAAFGTVGSSRDGGYAEYVALPARNLVPIPDGKSFVEAAAFALTYATAHAMLRRGRLGSGETVLIVGANGGLGYAALELAKAKGARVIAAVRRPHDLADSLKARGADHVLATGPELADQVYALTNGRGAQLAFEHVAAATFAESVAALGMDGRLVLGGVTSGLTARLDLKALFAKRLELLGCRGSGRRDLDAVLALWQQGRIRPHVHGTLPLAQAAEAHRLMEAGGLLGKLVFTV